MSEQEVLSGNKLLAEFMCTKVRNNVYKFNGITSTIGVKYLKYHSSYTWIFTVLEKIESLGYRWEVGMCSTKPYHYCKIWSIGTIEGVSPLDAIYGACVEFAKWYKNKTL